MPKRKLSKKGITIVGNPGEVTLHEAMEAVADWLDYEADVVENAAEEIADPEIAEAAEDQAEAMREAVDELEDAADAARETAAEIFTDGDGEPAADRVGDGSPEGDAIGGNPSRSFVDPIRRAADESIWLIDHNEGSNQYEVIKDGELQRSFSNLEDARSYLDRRVALIRGNPDELPIETNLPPETSSVPTDEPPRPLHWYKRPIGRRS